MKSLNKSMVFLQVHSRAKILLPSLFIPARVNKCRFLSEVVKFGSMSPLFQRTSHQFCWVEN